MKISVKNVGVLLAVLIVIAGSIWGPEALSRWRDSRVLGEIHTQEVEEGAEGYRYTLSSNERLFLLAECLNSQNALENERSALLDNGAEELSYQAAGGAYAFVVNHQGPSGSEITKEEIYDVCNRELDTFKELKILPDSVRNVEKTAYEATLYSAIDVLEPRNNIAVWKVSLSDSQKNADKSNRLIDAYIDADSGRIYEFYVRSSYEWAQIDPDKIVEDWREYLGLGGPEEYANDNPLTEMTPYYKKYVFEGMEEENTVVTVGFYEGIKELFIKISK